MVRSMSTTGCTVDALLVPCSHVLLLRSPAFSFMLTTMPKLIMQ